jgi:hypothetical protein
MEQINSDMNNLNISPSTQNEINIINSWESYFRGDPAVIPMVQKLTKEQILGATKTLYDSMCKVKQQLDEANQCESQHLLDQQIDQTVVVFGMLHDEFMNAPPRTRFTAVDLTTEKYHQRLEDLRSQRFVLYIYLLIILLTYLCSE